MVVIPQTDRTLRFFFIAQLLVNFRHGLKDSFERVAVGIKPSEDESNRAKAEFAKPRGRSRKGRVRQVVGREPWVAPDVSLWIYVIVSKHQKAPDIQ